MVITFVGGLGSIIAAAGVIGGAIAIARWERQKETLWLFGVFTWAALATLAVNVLQSRLNRYGGRVTTSASRYAITLSVVLVVFALLVWIGVAAGVK